MIKGKKILITGGAGFFGVHLSMRLIEDNNITIFDNFHRNALKYTNLEKHPHMRVVEGDVVKKEDIEKIKEHYDYIIHAAAIAGVDQVINRPIETMKVNFVGTLNVLEVFQDVEIERFVEISTSEVFGSYVYKQEEHSNVVLGSVGEARWTYAVSKLASEHLVYSFYRTRKMPTVTLRPFNIYGPFQVGTGAIHEFIERALNNQDIEIHNDGSQLRTWCYISDMIDAIILSLEKDSAVGHVFNIGNPVTAITVYNLAKLVKSITGSKSKLVFKSIEYKDVELRIPNINKAKELLGFNPKVDLEEGIKKTVEWYKKNIIT